MQAIRGRQSQDQRGFASLVIAIVLVLVLSLVTVGFAQLTRKEQRSSLDKQLSNQAYYAAESGINDAAKALNSGFDVAKTTCAPYSAADVGALPLNSQAGAQFLRKNEVKASTDNVTGASYTCLTIDPSPLSLEFEAVGDTQSKVVYVSGANPSDPTVPAPISSLEISWQDSNGGHSFVSGGGHSFTPVASWGRTGVLRITLTPLANSPNNPANPASRAGLIGSTYNGFLYPNASNSGIGSYSSAPVGLASGEIINGNCKTGNLPHDCRVKIIGLSQSNYLISMRSIYANSTVTIKAFNSANTQLRIKNAQTLVDSTGKAQDVLRRVQVRIPTRNTYIHPDFDLESAGSSICKQLQLTPDTAISGDNTNCPIN